MSTELLKEYNAAKTVKSGLKPVAGFLVIKYAIDFVSKVVGHDIPDEMSTKVSIGIFGAYRMFRNYMKNRKK